MYCKPKVNNGSITIYYGVDGVMRFPTGIKISKSKNRDKKFKEWDYKKNMVRVDVRNSTEMNKTIENWLTRADDIVSEHIKDGIKISAKELTSKLTKIKNGNTETRTSIFLDHYEDYMERKRIQIVERDSRSDISFITYGTFKSTIIDYEAENNIKLKIIDVANTEWLNSFHSWLTKPRPKQITVEGQIYKFKTGGKLKPSTVDKRFEVITGFFSYLIEKKLLSNDNFLKSYKRSEITVLPKTKTTLTIKEIHKLYDVKFESLAKENVKLLFLFACLTGFRWTDIENFDRTFIKKVNDRPVYEHIASKTKNSKGKISKIPLCDLAIKILKQLNYNLKIYSNGYTNRTLHKLLKETELFNQPTLAIDKNTGRKFKRYELLTMHRGRDTFITNLITTVPLHELMNYTSHEKLSTLQKYIDHSRGINPEYVAIFDEN